MKIKSTRYRSFLDNPQDFQPISNKEFEQFLANVQHKELEQARALVILLFYSGRRPAEIVQLTRAGIRKTGEMLRVALPTLKRGHQQTIFLPLNKHTQEVWDWVSSRWLPFETKPVFESFLYKTLVYAKKAKRDSDNRIIRNAKGEIEFERVPYQRFTTLNYWFKKWSNAVRPQDVLPPYIFRHNRLTQLAEAGASLWELKEFKGAKRLESVEPYIHITGAGMQKIAKKIK